LLKATKIGNYVSLNDDAIKISNHILDYYLRRKNIPEAALGVARKYLKTIRSKGLSYEGAITKRKGIQWYRGSLMALRGLAADIKNLFDGTARRDNHRESNFLSHYYKYFRNPIKGAVTDFMVRDRILDLDDLPNRRPFLFYPLHFEPEVSLQVFGRPYQNQIEVIRNIAISLPAGMDVVVKEHPRSRGFRTLAYYKKLLEIPNVYLINANVSTRAVIRRAALIAVISGSTGLEALIWGCPVIVLGKPQYAILPSTMIRTVVNPHNLGEEIADLLRSFKQDEEALERFIASMVAGSVPVDLYTVLLGKPDRIREGREGMSHTAKQQEDYQKLADYFIQRINEIRKKDMTASHYEPCEV